VLRVSSDESALVLRPSAVHAIEHRTFGPAHRSLGVTDGCHAIVTVQPMERVEIMET